MKRPTSLVLVVAMLAGALPRAWADAPKPSAAPTPSAEDLAEARRHFQRGVTFYKDGDFRSALVEFQEAYRISPNYKLLGNIAQTYEELADFAGAVGALRRFLAEGGSKIDAAKRNETEKTLRRLEAHVAAITLDVSEEGVTLVAEGERRMELGVSPLTEPVLLNGGAWTITARKTGRTPAEAKIVVAGGDKKTVSIVLAPVETAPTAPSSAPPPAATAAASSSVSLPSSSPPSRSYAPVWIGVAATGAFAIGAGVTGGLALKAKSDYDAALGRFGATAGEVNDARNRTKTFALATDVLGGLAIASAAVAVVLLVTGGPSAPKRDPGVAWVRFDGVGVYGAF